MDISLPDAESTVEFGRQLGRALNEQYAEGGEQVHIILFYGDLGSGKTTFTRGFIGSVARRGECGSLQPELYPVQQLSHDALRHPL